MAMTVLILPIASTLATTVEGVIMRRISGITLLFVPICLACSDRALDRKHAEQLIANLDEFKRGAFFSFETERPFTKGTIASACMPRVDAQREPVSVVLVKLGWVTFVDRPALIGFGERVSCPALVLTDKGKAASAMWQSRPDAQPGWKLWSVPIGERKLLEITGLTGAPDGSTLAEFTWRWMPNSLGGTLKGSVDQAQQFFERVRRGSAGCRRWDDGWRCKLAFMGTGFDDIGDFSIR